VDKIISIELSTGYKITCTAFLKTILTFISRTVFDWPLVWCFQNCPPQTGQLSADSRSGLDCGRPRHSRWRIRHGRAYVERQPADRDSDGLQADIVHAGSQYGWKPSAEFCRLNQSAVYCVGQVNFFNRIWMFFLYYRKVVHPLFVALFFSRDLKCKAINNTSNGCCLSCTHTVILF